MPNDAIVAEPRIVVDESSFDFRGLGDAEVEVGLDVFNDALAAFFRDGQAVAASSFRWEMACRDDCELHEFLFSRGKCEVSRDTLVRCQRLLDRCAEWDDWVPDACTSVAVDGEMLAPGFSIGFALTMAVRGRGVACLVFPGAPRDGFHSVRGDVGAAEIFFCGGDAELRPFWRHLFELENVAEKDFFDYALSAFPGLTLHPDLTYRKFQGSYLHLRKRVVAALAGINDHFERVQDECSRRGGDVHAALRLQGLDVSLESSNTHKSHKSMRQRTVDYNGQTYLCEWHAKLEPHRNRIHFTLPSKGPGNRILVGIFVDHLDT